ncbi:MAG TPA: MtrB/PioB family decaheme-associated outer membrane protein [Thiobacillaceae bacterium]|nr:MtrB/PioB family decaheme-associated outer membrane protein [Thiobacillaceae bacterium]
MPADKFPVRHALLAVTLAQLLAERLLRMNGTRTMRMFKARANSKGKGHGFLLLLAALGTIALSTRAFAVPPGMELVFEGGPKPVIFSGKVHADHGLKCKDCHTGLFKQEKGDAKIEFTDHLAGKKYCFACHNGTKAFASKGNCNMCHGNRSPSEAPAEPLVKEQTPEPPAGVAQKEAAPKAPPPPSSAAQAVPPPSKKAEEAATTGKACEDCPDYTGWSGWVEGGLGYQSNDSYHFGRYTGLEKSGGHVNAGADVRYRGKDGSYLDGKAIDLGLASRDVMLDGGKQGRYGIAVEYDQIPNFRAQDAMSPLVNEGGGRLGLPAGPAGLISTPLKTERDRLGARFSLIPAMDWEITGYIREEKKDGTRDLGGGFGFSQVTILPANLDYKTDDFGLTLGYKGNKLQAQLAYAGSLFKNGQDAITWDNPFLGAPSTGRIADAPDNQFHKISALLGYQLTDHTRLGAQLAFGRMTQDQNFLPYSTNPAFGSPATSSLDGQVDTTLAKADINSRPTPRLQLNASYTYSNRDNKTPVNTYNYIITDIAQATFPPPNGLPIMRQNLPYSFKQQLVRTKAAYILPKGANLSGGFDYDQVNRTYQQVEDTKDKTLWAKLKLRPTGKVETSLKYSYSSRDASTYLNNPLFENPVFPNSVNPLMQAFELADRRRNKIGLGVAVNPIEKLSLGLDLDYYKDDYKNMVLGLTQASGFTGTPSVTFVFSENLSASAYYTYENLKSDQASREWITAPPLSIPWAESDSNLTQTIGLNASWKAIPKKLDLGADAVYSKFTGKIQYAGATDLPDLTSSLTALGVHGNYKMKENLSLRAGLWYEKYEESDWAKNASVGFLSPIVLSLGTAPQDSDTVLVSFSVRYDFK